MVAYAIDILHCLSRVIGLPLFFTVMLTRKTSNIICIKAGAGTYHSGH